MVFFRHFFSIHKNYFTLDFNYSKSLTGIFEVNQSLHSPIALFCLMPSLSCPLLKNIDAKYKSILFKDIFMSTQINPAILNLKESSTLKINQQAKSMRANGETVYHFGFGQSPFPVHPLVVDALKAQY